MNIGPEPLVHAAALITPEKTKEIVDEMIRSLFKVRIKSAKIVGLSYQRLWEVMESAALAGGKRIRPYLTMLVEGSGDPRVYPVAVAQELIHIAILMHDDIIDQDFIRHGVDNVSGSYRTHYGKDIDAERATHYAHGAALLAGDALISEAYRMMYSAEYDDTLKSALIERLAQSIFDVIGGELIDVEMGFIHDPLVSPIQVYLYKTASYSFVGPIVSGAIAAGMAQDDIQILREFALNAGIGYQIQDDLLGVFGDEKITGKSSLTDLREGKRTVLVEAYEKLIEDERRLRFARSFGSLDATDEELSWIKEDIDRSGARQKIVDMADEYFDNALSCLGRLEIGRRRSDLEMFTNGLRGRNY